jgi:hypothetical protein
VETPNEIESIGRPAHDHSFYFGIVVALFGSSKSSSARCNKAKTTRETHDKEGGYELFIACRICLLLICSVSHGSEN